MAEGHETEVRPEGIVVSTTLRTVANAPHHELLIAEADDILIVVPDQGFKDTPEASRVTLAVLRDYAQKLGKKCGLVIVMNNLLAQEPESRRIYADGVTPDLFYGIVMVVTSPLARAIGRISTRLATLKVPLVLAESIEAGIAWSEANRSA